MTPSATAAAAPKTPHTLATLFGSVARETVLRVFMLDPLRAYYQRQIEGATNLSIRAVQRELERLASIELLYRHEEGNRAYYQVDMSFPLFPELRSIVLKTSSPADRLRGELAIDESVELAFLCEAEGRALMVLSGDVRPGLAAPNGYTLEVMSMDAFERALAESPDELAPFLDRGVDLLGRRDDVVWRRIAAAGFHVEKGAGVP